MARASGRRGAECGWLRTHHGVHAVTSRLMTKVIRNLSSNSFACGERGPTLPPLAAGLFRCVGSQRPPQRGDVDPTTARSDDLCARPPLLCAIHGPFTSCEARKAQRQSGGALQISLSLLPGRITAGACISSSHRLVRHPARRLPKKRAIPSIRSKREEEVS